jgi:hypothetical protein
VSPIAQPKQARLKYRWSMEPMSAAYGGRNEALRYANDS